MAAPRIPRGSGSGRGNTLEPRSSDIGNLENLVIDLLEWAQRNERDLPGDYRRLAHGMARLPIWVEANQWGLPDTAEINGR